MAGQVAHPGVGEARYGREVKTLAHAWSEFRHKRSPWVIATSILVVAVARVIVGDFSWRDAVAALAMVVIYPFGEWAIHVYLLHARPFMLRGRRIDLASAKAHREHHEAPNDLGLILLAPLEAAALLFLAVPLIPLIGAAVFALAPGSVPWPALLTAVLAGYVLVGIYEWTHFLIHTAYRPRSRYYRSIWKTHRLHHFKNEHYWHGITNTVGDRVLGTFPDQRDVERSATARSLSTGDS
jgi:sterol desaturase/sphingolipid hydroxylase (fatty acid hydroxylase superfamily)